MSAGRKHRVKEGESDYASLSRSHYGDDLGVALIKSANSGVPDPPPVGVVLIIPDRPPVLPPAPRPTAGVGPDECEVFVGGKRFRYWSTMTLTETLDAASTIQFTAPQSDTKGFRAAFQPMSFADLHVYIGGELHFTGTMLSPTKGTDATRGPTFSVGGYSRGGVLSDCTLPSAAYPFQLKGVGLKTIAERICAPWSLPVTVEGDMGGPFRRVRLGLTTRVLPFLTSLAKQRRVFVTSNEHGGLLLAEPPKVTKPVAVFEEGRAPFEGCRIVLDPSTFYSHMTVVRKKARRITSSSHTVVNPFLQGVLRPMNMQSEDTNSAAELPKSAEAKAGRMMSESVKWELDVAGWLRPDGTLFRRGDTVLVTSPSADILRPTELVVRSLSRSKSPESATLTLELSLPGAFSGVLPASMPWQG